MSLLHVEGLSSGYGRRTILKHLNLTISEGEVVAIVGPNGHGKSTFLKTISGLLPIDEGQIVFDGQDITRIKSNLVARSGVAHVPQGDLLFYDMSVYENLLLGMNPVTSPQSFEARLGFVYELFPKLKERREQIASTLSGGERRMTGIGRGLMLAGRLLMLDEPSLGLAPIVIDQIYDALQILKSRKTSILLVEENPERAATIADRVYVLDNGEFVWMGDGKELETNPEVLRIYLGG